MEVDIDDDLSRRLERRAAKLDFDSPEEYAAVILRTVIDELEDGGDEEQVERRLEDLGYL